MRQEFISSANVHVNRDDNGVVREVLHPSRHFVSAAPTPQLAAAEYLARFGSLLGLKTGETDSLTLGHAASLESGRGGELRFQEEKGQFDTTTVMYQQTHFGLPVWHAGIAIHMRGKPYEVFSSQSTRHPDVEVTQPSAAALERARGLEAATLAKQLELSRMPAYDAATLKIQEVKLIVYRYAAAKRLIVRAEAAPGGYGHPVPALRLPTVARTIAEGKHYVSAQVHFELAPHGVELFNWIAILDATTLSVLYLRPFVDDATGLVFLTDPMTTNSGPAPGATTAALNPVRTAVALQGLAAANPLALSGDMVQLRDVELPSIAPATEPPGVNFNFDARTDDFAAVNAYYHCDRFFRLLEDLGFTVAGFFGSGTAFPSTVDHRGLGGNVINAHCVGTASGAGIQRTAFALADTTDVTHPLGIACDFRVVLHELGGHGVLYPHVHSPNFGFAHSAGDSVAAIWCDPDSRAPDRFVTFPWVDIGRRHDRAVAQGWGWSGNIALHPFDPVLDGGGYMNEQILSTTLFRFYLAIGGAAAEAATRRFAARYAIYLLFRAISTLTPATNPSNAAGLATALINADVGDWTSEGETGGAYGKVIRWAFEQQGLYQPAGTATPNNNIGSPPPVDVYIEDGRHGEYRYQANHWSCQSIWNRRHNDRKTVHEEPIVGVTNYAYVILRNRGSQPATGVTVRAFHADPAAGLLYPNDWHPMTTAQLPAPNVSPNNSAQVTVGPFAWVPTTVGHECILMVASANGDPSNADAIAPGNSIPEWRLVPNDNNIGQRNVFPVAAGSLVGLRALRMRIQNPHRVTAKMQVVAGLPKPLVTAGWKIAFDNPGGGAFMLRPHQSKTIVLHPVAPVLPRPVTLPPGARADIVAFANGILVGGLTFTLGPAAGPAPGPLVPRAAKKGGKRPAGGRKPGARRKR